MAAKEPPKEKPKPLVIEKVRRTPSSINITFSKGDSRFKIEEPDNPRQAFYDSLDALSKVVATVCHLPPAWCAGDGFRVLGFDIGSLGGVDTVSIEIRKKFDDAAKELAFHTPERLLDHPADGGRYAAPLTPRLAEMVLEAVKQAKRYVNNDRAQGQIVFEEPAAAEKDPKAPEGAELPLGDSPTA